MYNEMKIRFHKSQVMMYEKARTLLFTLPNVQMLDAKKADFKAYGHFFCLLYKKFPTSKNLLMKTSTHNGAPTETTDTVRHDSVPDSDRAVWMKGYGIPCLVPPGLKDIKAVELYTKYCQLLPEEDKDETCREQPDGASERVKATKKRKEVAVGNRPTRASQKTKKPMAKQSTKANKDPKETTQPMRPATAYIFF
jgi:hypothetical protein